MTTAGEQEKEKAPRPYPNWSLKLDLPLKVELGVWNFIPSAPPPESAIDARALPVTANIALPGRGDRRNTGFAYAAHAFFARNDVRFHFGHSFMRNIG